jgi:hypothetical protein
LSQLSLQLEQAYADAFTYGFLGMAHKELFTDKKESWHVFHVGLR